MALLKVDTDQVHTRTLLPFVISYTILKANYSIPTFNNTPDHRLYIMYILSLAILVDVQVDHYRHLRTPRQEQKCIPRTPARGNLVGMTGFHRWQLLNAGTKKIPSFLIDGSLKTFYRV